MITSFYDGRVRIRVAALKDPETMSQAEAIIKVQEGVTHTLSNPRTGSLLIEYDPEKIPRETLLLAADVLAEQLNAAEEQTTGGCRLGGPAPLFNRKRKAFLLTSLFVLTVFSGFVSKRVHLGSGILLSLLTAKHLYDRRRCL